MRAQEKATGQKLSAQDKAAAIAKIERKSTEQAEQTLLGLFPEAASQIRQERTTVIDESTARLAVNLSNETLADLQRIKDLLSHPMPEASFADVIAHLAKGYLAREDRKSERRRKKDDAPLSRCGGGDHRLTARRRKQILARDKHCTYKDPKTGKICGSTYQLEVDHIHPKALGGADHEGNLRSLCRKHNLLMAKKTLGPWMKRYERSASACC
jgi:hypothetical protein